MEEFEEIAEQRQVGDLFRMLLEGLRGPLHPDTVVTAVAFYGPLDDGSRSIFGLLPSKSSAEQGLAFQAYLSRLARYLGRSPEAADKRSDTEHPFLLLICAVITERAEQHYFPTFLAPEQ